MRYSKIVFYIVGPFIFLLIVLGVACKAPSANESEKAFRLVPDEHGMVLKTPDGKTMFRYMICTSKITRGLEDNEKIVLDDNILLKTS